VSTSIDLKVAAALPEESYNKPLAWKAMLSPSEPLPRAKALVGVPVVVSNV
jgi:hypothetical protein